MKLKQQLHNKINKNAITQSEKEEEPCEYLALLLVDGVIFDTTSAANIKNIKPHHYKDKNKHDHNQSIRNHCS